MNLVQTIIEKNFIVKHKGKKYYVNYLNSDGQTLSIINRFNWEILDEDKEELNIYVFIGDTKEERKQIKKNMKLVNKLIEFCINHFNYYQPSL